ncbi:AMP-dependent synthetase/ligase [Streptomyces gobiensis]|uniref:AMP-dependent synthetase/ligase n=1 Tax=Streptomyces gobiensis TaxID=2875706 RepID=UPI001E5579BE|nr:AMP-dependent synthetase/ligase [Streptomyces gobiensis]UGY91949.1 AMP-dependent synthetase/ligase [Streptomyces gobiensis]
MSDAATLCEAFQRTAATRGRAPALRTVQGDVLTWAQYAERVASVAAGLHGLGVRHGDTVALMLTNRPEFHVADCAAFHLGAIPFSLYNTLPPDQLTDVLTRARARVLVTERRFLALLRPALAGTDVEHLVTVDGSGPGDDAIGLAAVEAAAPTGFDFAATWQRVRPGDLLTLIHTSGTTGRSKAVEITHAGMTAQLDATDELLGITHEDSHLSFLPAAHIADRWASHYTNIRFGTRLTCVPDLKDLPDALTSVRPTLFGAVPAVWQRLKAGLDAALTEADPGLRALVEGCIDTACRLAAGRRAGTLTAEQAKELDEAEPVLAELRKRIGLDRARVCVTGAAPASAGLVEFFHAIGVPLGDAWGMSELSGMALMNPPGDPRPGTVGRPVPGARIRVAEDGELLVSAPFVMRGYRDEPGLTAGAIDSDGWLHTGDVVTVDDDGNVRIIDRKKDIIINTGGKNMSPTRIESVLLEASPLIGHVVVIGDGRPYNVALITPDREAVTARAAQTGAVDAEREIAAAVEYANTRLSRPERIRAHAVLRDAWEPGGPELTVTLKVRRGAVEQRYAQLIESFYAR